MSFNCCSEIEKGFSFRKDSFFDRKKRTSQSRRACDPRALKDKTRLAWCKPFEVFHRIRRGRVGVGRRCNSARVHPQRPLPRITINNLATTHFATFFKTFLILSPDPIIRRHTRDREFIVVIKTKNIETSTYPQPSILQAYAVSKSVMRKNIIFYFEMDLIESGLNQSILTNKCFIKLNLLRKSVI